MNALGAFLTLFFCALICAAPRRLAVLGVFASVSYVTQNQAVDIGGFNFFSHRIILFFGMVRVLARGEIKEIKFNKVDWAFLGFAVLSPLITGIRTGNWQEQIGGAYNMLLSYFLFRCLVTNWEDIQALLPQLAFLIIPLALFMALESFTGKNVFDIMGERLASGWLREERIRCIGSFRGPHTAGIFGATLIPLFASLYFEPRHRGTAITGLLAATVITVTSNSSGPLMGFLSSLLALAFWPLRKEMRKIRWGILISLVGLALIMRAPIWYIFSKISDITGGDGWSRSYLMEQCFTHMSDWWLLGTDNTAGWASTEMEWGGADLCNLYVSCAANAGLTGLILMILILVRCFSSLGKAISIATIDFPDSEKLLWACGCSLFAHVCTLFSVTYWDQLFVIWWGFLAVISSVTHDIIGRARENRLNAKYEEERLRPADETSDGYSSVSNFQTLGCR